MLIQPQSVVAIHGINGHCVNSWTNAKSGTYWLRDLLPEKLPLARIMTFQYDAKVLGNKSTYGIRDIAAQLLNELVQCRDGAVRILNPLLWFSSQIANHELRCLPCSHS